MIWFVLACTGTEESKPDSSPVYYGDVDAIIQEHCTRCHTTGGQAMSFDKAEDVQAMAPTILAYLDSGYMPPPAPDPECRDYHGSDRLVLDDTERSRVKAWVNTGAALGEEKNASPPVALPTLYPWDVELRAPLPYTPSFEDGENDYRCFRMPLNNADTVYLTGFEALVDNPAIVHHVVIYDATGARAPEDPGGFACNGFGESGWEFVAGWAPGGEPGSLPEGLGIPMAPNSELVLQMHYYNSFDGADQEVDQSGYGLILADSVEHEVMVFSLGTYNFVVPAGNPAYESAIVFPWKRRYGIGHVLGVFPHMHLLGTAFDLNVTHPDSTQTCLSKLKKWDFHNQVTSFFKEESLIQEGDSVFLRCEWDNSSGNPNQSSDPPQDVSWGEGTTEEMCFGFTYLWLE
ncbi:MAG TPA: hypothetical protein PKY30_16720 [Myxococcota bacterium]|nr:hypothetical protein [Myxococcota bacterium]HNH48687.1 hypothetical protein [Myxococcota bacterium]